MPDVLLTTLGITWQIVPELYAFTNPGDLDLYANHPQRERLAELRHEFGLHGVDRIWVVTTKGAQTGESLNLLWKWWSCLPESSRPDLIVWRVDGTLDLASESECRRMREAVYRMVMHAWEEVGAENVVLSLAGGRKTMSSDMHQAASIFGTKALVHVVDNPGYSRNLRDMGPEDFTRPLPSAVQDAVTPLITGRFDPNPLLEVPSAESGLSLMGANFPLPRPDSGAGTRMVDLEVNSGLVQEVESRTRQAEVLLCNYLHSMRQVEGSSNFLAFRLLRRRTIRLLKEMRIGTREDKASVEKAWLRKLPKAELHCHLGGVADPVDLLDIARANADEIARYAGILQPWLDAWRDRLDRGDADALGRRIDWKALRRAVPGVPEPLCVAAFLLLFDGAPDELDRVIYGSCREESRFLARGFETYERFGDLQGSGLLQNESSIRAACRVLARKAKENNVQYLEVRCSPVNYTRGGLSPEQVVRCIRDELSRTSVHDVSVLFIASRHGSMDHIQRHVELARAVLENEGDGLVPLCGFDLAGSEEAKRPEEMRRMLMPMLEECMHMTIHAGETQKVQSIWEAVYHLSAERVGHGLTLAGNPALMEKFRDRDICLEMCPSSNMQIVGFRDAFLPSTAGDQVYPLKEYLDRGLRVTVNTDNPGISRTDMTNELHRAARMTPGGLSLWDICAVIRNGFRASFATRDVRHRLLRQAEEEIVALIQQGIWP